MARPTWRSVGAILSAISLFLAPVAYAETGAGVATTTLHVVAAGETLSQIAADAGVDLTTLAALNGVDDPNFLRAGESIRLPSASASPATAAVGSASPPAPAVAATAGPGAMYTVVDGDTLSSIAHQFSTTTTALADANHLDNPDHVVIGTQLVLPAGATATGPGPIPSRSTSPANASSTAAPRVVRPTLLVSYTVQAGETLSQIARQFEVRPEEIAQSSGLDDPNRLSVGAVLKVPLPGREHVVAAGETLRDIAAQEKVDLGTLIDFNAIDDPELIHIGQVVLVPGTPNRPVATTTAAAAPAASSPKPGADAPAGGVSAGTTAQASAAAPPATRAAPPSTTPPSPPTTPPSPPTPPPSPSAAPASLSAAGARSASAAATGPASPSAASSAPAATAPAGAAKPKAPAPAAPLVVVAPPPGAPTDGLAGAGLKLLGAPYVWGGSSPAGFDCSGFVWYIARQIGKPLSRGMFGEYNSGSHPGRDELKPGDLVFFQNTYSAGLSHNGVYIGGNQFVHAADETAGVTISSLGTAYWSSHWFGATRLP